MEKSGSSSFNIRKEGLMPQEEMLEVGSKQKTLKIGIPFGGTCNGKQGSSYP